LLLALLLGSNKAWAHEERFDGHFSLIDSKGDVLFQTALAVSLGDEFIAEDNSHYRVANLGG